MKFRCERDTLGDALTAAARAVSTRGGALPVLAGVRVELVGERLALTGSDLDLTISVTVPVSGSGDGVAVFPARLTSEIVRSLEPGAVDVETANDEARITSGRSQFSVRLVSADEFPRLAEPSGDPVSFSAHDLTEALRQVVPAASADDARPILTGVLMTAEGDGLRLVATDSYRLAVRDLRGTSVLSADREVLVPRRALSELTRLLGDAEEVTLRLGERDAGFEVDGVCLMARLIEGEFPDYRGLIPDSHPNRLTVGREVLLDAVKRVRIMASEATPVRLVQGQDSLELMALSQELGQAHEAVDAKYEGAELTVAFNPDFLIAGVEATPGDEVTLETIDALKPAVLRSTERDDFLYLLMPVRVS